MQATDSFEPRRISPARLLGATATGVLVVLSFPVFGSSLGIGGLVWLCLVPLILATRAVGWRRGLILGASAGIVVEASGFIWILVAIQNFTNLPGAAAAAGFLAWAAYSTVPWMLLGGAFGACAGTAGRLWVVPLWIAIEHWFPRVFPWHLGGALHSSEWLVQTADVWGASGLSGLVLLVSVAIAGGILRLARRERFLPLPAALAAVLVAASLGYGRLRLEAVRRLELEAPTLTVGLVQGALDPTRETESLDRYLAWSRDLVARRPVDLIVWPEGSAEGRDPATGKYLLFDANPDANRAYWARSRAADIEPTLRRFVDESKVPLIAGGPAVDFSRDPMESNALAYLRPGLPPVLYEKNIRVPLGEVVPFLGLVPASIRQGLGLRVGTIAAGRSNPVLPHGALSLRSLICYEATLPGYFARSAAGADALVNVTQDIWYGRTAHVPQHVSVLQLRVIENRTPLVRVTNMGPSGVFRISGTLDHGLRISGDEATSAYRIFGPETRVVTLRARSLPTVYRTLGRWLPLVCAVLALARGAAVLFRRRSDERRLGWTASPRSVLGG